MNGQMIWWRGILARSLLAVIGITLLVGIPSVIVASQVVSAQVHERATQKLGELLDTVQSTASVACFADDEQLAHEVAQGLLRNSEVQRVDIRAAQRSIARLARPQTRSSATGSSVTRPLFSPFNAEKKIGEIILETNDEAIQAQIAKSVALTVFVLVPLIFLVIAAAAGALLILVIRPIKQISDRMHRLKVTSGERLAVPEGHQSTELGRLVEDINGLTGQLVDALGQERALREQQEIDQRKYHDLFDNASAGIFIAQGDGRLDSFNRAFVGLTWLPARETGDGARSLFETGWDEPQALLGLLRRALESAEKSAEGDFRLVGRRGDARWLQVGVIALGDGSVQGTVNDVTQRKEEEMLARRLAVTDSLTSFANREGLAEKLAELPSSTPPFALVRIDLDGFRQIVNATGFVAGDRILLEVAKRLRQWMRAKDFPARVGSGEFALLLGQEQDALHILDRLEALVRLLSQPYANHDGSHAVVLGARIGAARFPQDGGDFNQLMRRAEIALNTTGAGQPSCQLFDPSQEAAAEYRRRLEDDLRAAIGRRELELYCQPIVDLATRRVAGGEALLRWRHPQLGPISPEIFVPLAEQIGLIDEVGYWVLEEACRNVALWRTQKLALYASVNVSARQIPEGLPVPAVLDLLARYGLPPSAIALEITEGVLMSDVTVAQTWVNDLRRAGLRVFMDDFGTGYSSLSYLKRFPLDVVKIDKSFISDPQQGSNEFALVEAIITMARSLGLQVVAEGIEDEFQLRELCRLGCGYGQGYFFSRPVAMLDFVATAARLDADRPGA